VRFALAAENVVRRLRGSSFRAFLRSPAAILTALRREGPEPTVVRRTLTWEAVVCRRVVNGRDAIAADVRGGREGPRSRLCSFAASMAGGARR